MDMTVQVCIRVCMCGEMCIYVCCIYDLCGCSLCVYDILSIVMCMSVSVHGWTTQYLVLIKSLQDIE